jgi:hypothetical protein
LYLYHIIIAIYQELYGQATIRANYKYEPPRKDRLLICKFIKHIRSTYKAHQLTQDFFIGYFEFQFSRYSGVKTPRGKNNIMLNWLVGEKAIKAWEARSVNKRYLVKWRINKDFKLTLNQAFKKTVKVKTSPFLLTVNPWEERAKQRFYNKPQGYLYCAQMTTLYNPKSSLCGECSFKEACIERLKINYANLYQKRMKHEQATV